MFVVFDFMVVMFLLLIFDFIKKYKSLIISKTVLINCEFFWFIRSMTAPLTVDTYIPNILYTYKFIRPASTVFALPTLKE